MLYKEYILKSDRMNLLWYIIIGIVAGYAAGKLTNRGGMGILLNLVVGIIGGVLGGWVFGLFGFAATGMIGNLVTSTIGAILLLWIASLFSK